MGTCENQRSGSRHSDDSGGGVWGVARTIFRNEYNYKRGEGWKFRMISKFQVLGHHG